MRFNLELPNFVRLFSIWLIINQIWGPVPRRINAQLTTQTRRKLLDPDQGTYEITIPHPLDPDEGVRVGCTAQKLQDAEEILELFFQDEDGENEIARMDLDLETLKGRSEKLPFDLRWWPQECVSGLLAPKEGEELELGESVWNWGDSIGCNCPAGEPGKMGPIGQEGPEGPKGADARNGTNGRDGRNGRNGLKGSRGDKGPKGVKGDRGETGKKGEEGPKGPKGLKGRIGRKYRSL